jgi:hypothetical protein
MPPGHLPSANQIEPSHVNRPLRQNADAKINILFPVRCLDAPQLSAIGPELTSRDVRNVFAIESKAEVTRGLAQDRF